MKLFHQIVAVCMAVLVLVSTTSFALTAHFCGDELQDLAFSDASESCEAHMAQLPPCHGEHDAGLISHLKKKNCCEDQALINNSEEFLKDSIILKIFSTDNYIVSFVASFLVSSLWPHVDYFLPYSNYAPPLIERDISVLVQSFLL